MTELWALLMWTLADSEILPFQTNDYVQFMEDSLAIVINTHNATLKKYNISTGKLHLNQ